MMGRKGVRYQSNLSLQNEEELSYATYLEYLKRLGYFKRIKWCVPAVHAQILKRIEKIP